MASLIDSAVLLGALTVCFVDGIKVAELAYNAALASYLPVGSEASARAELFAFGSSKVQRDWIGGPDWEKLGWSPDGKVRGAYWVETTATGFRVVGIRDVDGDGREARYEADEHDNATLQTESQVY